MLVLLFAFLIISMVNDLKSFFLFSSSFSLD